MKNKERRAELLQQYNEIKIKAGVYQIRNTLNGKIFIDTTPNLKSLNGKSGLLELGHSPYKELQREWTEFGAQAFVFEVLEVLPPNDNPYVKTKDELKKLREKWLDKLQPYGERGYHKRAMEQ
jgi:hypothetical protein